MSRPSDPSASPPPAAGFSASARAKVVLGVTGCIGAYKAPDLVRALRRRNLRVQVILTRAAREFVSPLALATVSGEPVLERLFDDESDPAGGVRHISLTEETDVFLVAPATAHVIARLALGLADDFLTTFHLAQRAPMLVAPAMNTNMLQHPATRSHLAALEARGVGVIAPGVGELACGWMGPGRLPQIPALVAAVETALGRGRARSDLRGLRVLVAAGPTREPLDPVRYLSNRSSGRMGAALAAAARDRGAAVTLVLGPTGLEAPSGIGLVRVETAVEMRDAVVQRSDAMDAVVMAAAVADFRPAVWSPEKLKSAALRAGAARDGTPRTPGEGETPAVIRLLPNPDILAELGSRRAPAPDRRPRVLVGFAAETEDPEAEAVRKLEGKRCDLIVGNRVGPDRVFGQDRTEAVLVRRRSGGGSGAFAITRRSPESKRRLADAVWSAALRLLERSRTRDTAREPAVSGARTSS